MKPICGYGTLIPRIHGKAAAEATLVPEGFKQKVKHHTTPPGVYCQEKTDHERLDFKEHNTEANHRSAAAEVRRTSLHPLS